MYKLYDYQKEGKRITYDHAERARFGVFEVKVLVWKVTGTCYGGGAGAVAVDKVAGFDQAVLLYI